MASFIDWYVAAVHVCSTTMQQLVFYYTCSAFLTATSPYQHL